MSRALVVFAILAALFGAPPAVSGAANALIGATASPTGGTTQTAFTLRVVYAGQFAALSVTLEVAGRSEPMVRIAGTPVAGTWETTVRLPAGSWPTRFRATAERGSNPVLDGPVLTVSTSATAVPTVHPQPTPPAPTPSPSAGAELPGGPGGGRRSDALTPPPSSEPNGPPAAPAPPNTPPDPPSAGGSADEAASASGTAASGPPGHVAPARSPNPGGDGESDPTPKAASTIGDERPTSRPGAARRVEPGDRPATSMAAAPMNPDPSAEPGEGTIPLDDELLLTSTRATAAWLAAILAVVVVVLALAARRRSAAAADASEAPVEAEAPALEAERILRRRAIRAAQRRLADEDPIIAAMELGKDRDRPDRS